MEVKVFASANEKIRLPAVLFFVLSFLQLVMDV